MWKEFKLSEIGKIITGKTPKTSDSENFGGDILFLTPSDNMNSKYILDTKRSLSRKGLTTVKNCLISENSISVSCIGSDLGKVVINKKDTVTNQQINSLVIYKEFDLNFIYYSLVILGKKLNYHSKTSTAVPIVNKFTFSNYEIKCPIFTEQVKIGRILSNIDDKIELNNTINKNLEEQCQLNFKTLFNSNDININMNKIKLADLIVKFNKKCTPDKNQRLIDLANMPRFSIALDSYDNGDKLGTNTYEMKKYNFLFGSIRPYFGKVGIAPFDGITTGTIHQFGVINDFDYSLVCILISSLEFINYADKMSHGTKMPIFNWDALCNYEFLYSEEKAKELDLLTKNLLLKIVNNVNENIKLTELRESLLPKLMSGEIDVSDLDI